MKVNPIVVKSGSIALNLFKRTANYWVVEPALNIFRPIMKSVRYAIFLSILGGSGYACYHPEVVTNFIKSCLPKITVEAPEILKERNSSEV